MSLLKATNSWSSASVQGRSAWFTEDRGGIPDGSDGADGGVAFATAGTVGLVRADNGGVEVVGSD